MEPYVGQIMLFAGNFAPQGWAMCNGQMLQIRSYQALFSIIGNYYGGDGIQLFQLPDLRGRVPIHFGSNNEGSEFKLAESGGNERTSLQISNLPAHSHVANGGQVSITGEVHAQMKVNNSEGSESSPSLQYLGIEGSATGLYANSSDGTTLASDAIKVDASQLSGAIQNISIGATGNNMPFSNMQPFLVMNYIIALEGIYPSRGY
jgi:microcystin-dependent protein